MTKRETSCRIFVLFFAGIGILFQTAIIALTWYIYYNPFIRIPFWNKGHYFIMGLYFISLFFFAHIYGGLKIGYLKKSDLLFSQIFSLICANILFYLEICLLAYRLPVILPLTIGTLIEIMFIFLWNALTTILYDNFFPALQALLIYGEGTEEAAYDKFDMRKDHFKICETVCINEDLQMIFEKIGRYSTVILWDIPSESRSHLIKYCYGKNIAIYTIPKISDVITSGAEVMHFFDTPLFLIRSHPLMLEQLVLKRLMDILLATTMIILLSPVMLITAACIKLYDHGPILYKQIRCTTNQKKFYIYKFRSMIVEAEKDGIARLAQKHDTRITPLGAFIRKVRIDELPQLINVLNGDMSFVGPRPERPEIIKQYQYSLPEFTYRMKVKAGLTGYAQIYGKYNTLPYDKLKLDLYYIEHYSLWLDIKLLILTAKIIFTLESTEGVPYEPNS